MFKKNRYVKIHRKKYKLQLVYFFFSCQIIKLFEYFFPNGDKKYFLNYERFFSKKDKTGPDSFFK